MIGLGSDKNPWGACLTVDLVGFANSRKVSMSKCKINCTRVSQPSSKITITNVIFLHFVNSKESFCRGNSKMTHTCCALDIKVKKCKLCPVSVLSENLFIDFQDCTQTLFIQGFTETVFYWNFTQTLVFGRL